MKKLLVLTSTFPKGKRYSVPGFINELCKRLSSEFHVFVLAPFAIGTPNKEKIGNVTIFRFKYWFGDKDYLTDKPIIPTLAKKKILWLMVPFFIISQFFTMCRILLRERITTIHAHWIIPQGLLAVLYKMIFNKDVRIILTSHGADIYGMKHLNFLKKWIVNNSSGISVVSKNMKTKLESIGISRNIPVRVIPMGVDFSRFHPNNYSLFIRKKYGISGPFLLFVGRLTEKKGVSYLINAMPSIIKKHPNAKLLIIGYGEERPHLEKVAENLGIIGNHVIFKGAVPNAELPKYYATADIFIGPSIIASNGDQEGFGLVFVEALGCGCIPVSSNLMTICDIVIDGHTGYTVNQKSIENIANIVCHILDNPEEKKKILSYGRRYVLDRFDWVGISSKYTELLNTDISNDKFL